jgi:hypothetical protein
MKKILEGKEERNIYQEKKKKERNAPWTFPTRLSKGTKTPDW